MRYFLMIGLMMVGSVAQANICIPFWWGRVLVPQIEIEAEYQGPLAMNGLCGDGKRPLEVALENNDDPAIFKAIADNFQLYEEDQYQVRRLLDMQLRESYDKLLSRVGSIVEERSPTVSVVRVPLNLLDAFDEYEVDEETRSKLEDIADMQLRQSYGDLVPGLIVHSGSDERSSVLVMHVPSHFNIPDEYEVDAETRLALERIEAIQFHKAYRELLSGMESIISGDTASIPKVSASELSSSRSDWTLYFLDIPDEVSDKYIAVSLGDVDDFIAGLLIDGGHVKLDRDDTKEEDLLTRAINRGVEQNINTYLDYNSEIIKSINNNYVDVYDVITWAGVRPGFSSRSLEKHRTSLTIYETIIGDFE